MKTKKEILNTDEPRSVKLCGFLNSWGVGWGSCGRGWLEEDYFNKGLLFSSWVLVDLISNNKNMKLAKQGKHIYLIDETGKFGWSIPNEDALGDIITHFLKCGIKLEDEVEMDLTGYYIVRGATDLRWKNFLNF